MKAKRLAEEAKISIQRLQETLNNLGYNESINEDTEIPEEIEDLTFRHLKIDMEYNARAEDLSGIFKQNKIRENIQDLEGDCIAVSQKLLFLLSQNLIKNGIIDRRDIIHGTKYYDSTDSRRYLIYSRDGKYGLLNRYFDHLTSPKYSEIIISKKSGKDEKIYAKYQGAWGILLPELNYLFKPHYDNIIQCLDHNKEFSGYDIGVKANKYTIIESHINQLERSPETYNCSEYDYASGFDYGFCSVKIGKKCYLVDSYNEEYAYINKKGQVYREVNQYHLKKGFFRIKDIKPFYNKEIEEFVFICENNIIIKVAKDDFICGYRDFIMQEEYDRYLDRSNRYYDDVEDAHYSSSMADCWDAMTDGKYGEMPDDFDGDFSFLGR